MILQCILGGFYLRHDLAITREITTVTLTHINEIILKLSQFRQWTFVIEGPYAFLVFIECYYAALRTVLATVLAMIYQ